MRRCCMTTDPQSCGRGEKEKVPEKREMFKQNIWQVRGEGSRPTNGAMKMRETRARQAESAGTCGPSLRRHGVAMVRPGSKIFGGAGNRSHARSRMQCTKLAMGNKGEDMGYLLLPITLNTDLEEAGLSVKRFLTLRRGRGWHQLLLSKTRKRLPALHQVCQPWRGN